MASKNSGSRFLRKVIKSWNHIERPIADKKVTSAAEHLIIDFRSKQIEIPSGGFQEVLSEAGNCRDYDPKFFARFSIQIGEGLNLNFMIFIGYYTLAVQLLDVEGDVAGAHGCYQKMQNRWFDDLSEQYYFGNSALPLISMNKPEFAIKHLQRAVAIAINRGDQISTGMYYQNMGVAFRAKGDLSEAKKCYEQALKISETIHDGYWAVRQENLRAINKDIEYARQGILPNINLVQRQPEEAGQSNAKIRFSRQIHNPLGGNYSRPILDLAPGEYLLGDYQIHSVLDGSMARVYVLKNPYDEPHAKEYLCAKTFTAEYMSTDLAKRRFIEEVENWLLLGRYEHILWAHTYEVIDNQPFVFMQYATSGSMKELFSKGFHPDQSFKDQVLTYIFAFGLALGMKHIYARLNLPHGDLRPDNILFSEKGGLLIKISDFGIMSVVKSDLKRAVEQDIRQFGKLLWYLLTGTEETQQRIMHQLNLHKWIPEGIKKQIKKALMSTDNNGYDYFSRTTEEIEAAHFQLTGQHLLNPQEYHQKAIAELSKQITGTMDEKFGVVKSIAEGPFEPIGSIIARAESLTQVGKLEDVLECYKELLGRTKSDKDSDDSKKVWESIRKTLAGIGDIELRNSFFKSAYELWNT